MTNEKHFPETISQWEFDYGLILPRIIVICGFASRSFKLKRGILPLLTKYLSWQNLKTTCHVKLKLFLWTKLLENLLLAKYLTSAPATLKDDIYGMRWWGLNIKFFSVFSSSLDSRLIYRTSKCCESCNFVFYGSLDYKHTICDDHINIT